MSITRMEAQLARLNATIAQRQTELAELKDERKEIKAQIAGVKKAVKDGKSAPDAEPEGLAERIGAALTENVIDPIADMLSPPSKKGRR